MTSPELFTVDIRGKSGRGAFFVSLVIGLSMVAIAVFTQQAFNLEKFYLSKIAVVIFGLWTTIIEIRRLHDIGWSGWLVLIFWTPLNILLIVWLLFAPRKNTPLPSSWDK